MKSERRHELQTNELADWLAGVLEKIKPYRHAILGVLLLAVVSAVGLSWWTRKSAAREAAGWDQLFTAMDQMRPSDFETVIEQNPHTAAAHWAHVMAGDLFLAEGCDQLFINKAVATEQLRSAEEHYRKALEEARQPSIREQATFGLARTLEAQGKSLTDARAYYQQVLDQWPDGAYATMAARRLEDLNKESTRLFYHEDFAAFDPTALATDSSTTPEAPLDFSLDDLPEEPPSAGDLLGPEKPTTKTPTARDESSEDHSETPASPDAKTDPAVPQQASEPSAATGEGAAAADDAAPNDPQEEGSAAE